MTKGLSGAGFDVDLLDAQTREGILAAILGEKGHRVEVKSDKLCQRTGNLFIEFSQHGRPSGIAISEAEWWAFEYENDCWLIVPAERLKQVAREAYRQGRRTKGGDYDNYEGVLLPISWLVSERAL